MAQIPRQKIVLRRCLWGPGGVLWGVVKGQCGASCRSLTPRTGIWVVGVMFRDQEARQAQVWASTGVGLRSGGNGAQPQIRATSRAQQLLAARNYFHANVHV
jgi:hypothetical protein